MSADLLDDAGVNGLVRARHGLVLYNRNDMVIGRSIAYYGEYFESEVRLFAQMLRPGDVVADVGANIGAHTLALARIVGPAGRVIAFEPVRLLHQMLCANMALNALRTVDCVHAAVGDRGGTLLLGDPPLDGEGNFGALALDALAGTTPVSRVRLDDRFDGSRLRLVKVDVEGMEADVLRGAAATLDRFRPALYVENDRVESSRALILLLRDLDYACFWYVAPLHNPANHFGRREPLFRTGFVGTGERLQGMGLGINLLCVPKEAAGAISGLPPVLDPDEHPLLRSRNARFAGGG